jgi:hypothetical protein
LVAALLLSSLWLAACNEEDAPRGTAGPQPTPADATAIRSVDFTQNAEVQRLLSLAGSGRLEPGTVVYGDVTGDLREDAIVPIASGGTLGNIAYLVFVPSGGSADLVLSRTLDRSSAGGLKMAIEDGRLVESAAVYAPTDPLCCPSALRLTTFRWDGSRLQVEREVQVQQTPGPKQ